MPALEGRVAIITGAASGQGKAAAQDIKAPDGQLLEKAGTVRDGGSYNQRMGAIACWNAVMDENIYMVQKWNEFIAA